MSCEVRSVSCHDETKSLAGIHHRVKVQANLRDRQPIEARIDELLLKIAELQSRVGRQATQRANNAGNNAGRLGEDIKEPQSQVAGGLNRARKAENIDSLLAQPRKWNQRREVLRKELRVWKEWCEKSRLKFG